jgi:hypothetical protein
MLASRVRFHDRFSQLEWFSEDARAAQRTSDKIWLKEGVFDDTTQELTRAEQRRRQG